MRNNPTGSIRMGPITLITFVIILCLAVLSVLAVTTAKATKTEADRQISTADTRYSLEDQAQRYLAEVDAWLATDGAGAASAAATLAERDGGTLDAETATCTITFTEAGRTLTVGLHINEDMTYEITNWTISSDWSPDNDETLWTGN